MLEDVSDAQVGSSCANRVETANRAESPSAVARHTKIFKTDVKDNFLPKTVTLLIAICAE